MVLRTSWIEERSTLRSISCLPSKGGAGGTERLVRYPITAIAITSTAATSTSMKPARMVPAMMAR